MTTDGGTFLDRWPRRTRMIGGTLDGRDLVLPIPAGYPDPAYRCFRRGRGEWEHYVRDDVDVYVYAAPCADLVHDGPAPDGWGCCCGRDDCDGSGSWPVGLVAP